MPAVRILVPDYSEVYPVEDLIWDNTNKSLEFREAILCLHELCDEDLEELLVRLEVSELDNYTDIRTLIGIEFDENSVWGQLTLIELKLLIHLALGQLPQAKELVEAFLQYNDNTLDRALFYRAMDAVIEVELDSDMALEHYLNNFTRMFGKERVEAVVGSVDGSIRFYGLEPVGMELAGLERHQRLIQSYQKLHQWRASKWSGS